MDNQIQLFNSAEFGTIRVNVLADREIEINLEDAARGLGFTVEQTIGGKTYSNIRWDRVKQYLVDVGFLPEVVKDAYIPERVFYKLAMKANNDTARRFQGWIADVVHDIRKNGVYLTADAAERILNDPDFIIKLAQQVKDARSKIAALEETVAVQNQQIAELQPKGAFYDLLLNCKGAWPVSKVAADYGMKAPAFNQLLHEMGLQYQQGAPGKKYWLLTQKALDLQGDGERWTVTETKTFQNANGEPCVGKPFMRWTQNGRIALYYLLKERGILPKAERPHTDD